MMGWVDVGVMWLLLMGVTGVAVGRRLGVDVSHDLYLAVTMTEMG